MSISHKSHSRTQGSRISKLFLERAVAQALGNLRCPSKKSDAQDAKLQLIGIPHGRSESLASTLKKASYTGNFDCDPFIANSLPFIPKKNGFFS